MPLNLPHELRPERLLPALTAGLIAGILVIVTQVSLAALIYAGDLSGFLSRGLGFGLFACMLTAAVIALTSSLPGMVGLPQDIPAALLAVTAATVAVNMRGLEPQNIFVTVAVSIGLCSLLTALVALGLGAFRLGRLMRYIPYPVIGGFLAGTGWFLVRGL